MVVIVNYERSSTLEAPPCLSSFWPLTDCFVDFSLAFQILTTPDLVCVTDYLQSILRRWENQPYPISERGEYVLSFKSNACLTRMDPG